MELREALTQIAEIRQQMVRSHVFRGYRAVTTALTGVVALVNGVLLSSVMYEYNATKEAGGFSLQTSVITWVAAAAVCLVLVAIEMIVRTRRSSSEVQRQLTLMAVEQFIPSVVAGGLLTWVFLHYFPAQLGLWPGLWMILFSLGIFASTRLLPRAVFGVGAFYLVAGIFTLIMSPVQSTLLNIYMGIVFGAGQLALAGILYLKLERHHD